MPGYPAALPDLAGFGERCLAIDDSYAGARLLARRLVTLPVHSRLRRGTLRKLEEWLGGSLEPAPVTPAGAVAL
jgi:hypothetical protein